MFARNRARTYAACLCCWLLVASIVRAEGPETAASIGVDAAWLEELSERADQLTRVLLSAMAAARDEGQVAHARCFDRALHELTSLKRQVAFHSTRALDATSAYDVRERHARALLLSRARLDFVAQSTARCGSDGAPLAHGQTRVETTIPR